MNSSTFYFFLKVLLTLFEGIKLKNNIIIIDEAHNLLEAMAQMYSSETTCSQLYHSHQQLKNYKAKYSTRFSATNLLCINQLIFIIGKLIEILGKFKQFDPFLKDSYNLF